MTTGTCSITQVGDFKFMIERSDLQFKNDDVMIEVKDGWYTDGGSIPKIFHNIISPLGGKQLYGFLIHDAMWLMREEYKGMYSMEDTNSIMGQVHKDCGVPWWKRKLIQIGVSKWTYFAWRKWNNPSEEVKNWHKHILTFKWSKK